jgi:hypothetical protein
MVSSIFFLSQNHYFNTHDVFDTNKYYMYIILPKPINISSKTYKQSTPKKLCVNVRKSSCSSLIHVIRYARKCEFGFITNPCVQVDLYLRISGKCAFQDTLRQRCFQFALDGSL